MKSAPGVLALEGALLWMLLVVPPIRQALQATMTAQMLVQIPLLVIAGWLISGAVPRRVDAALARWNSAGVTGVLLASVTAAMWMLPRMLDASVDEAWVAAAKFTSIPLLIGVPLALSWPLMAFVVRGVFLLELTASAFRMGWLYLVSPMRLCSNYLLSDQQLLGRLLLVLGAALCLLLAWKLIWGRVRVDRIEA